MLKKKCTHFRIRMFSVLVFILVAGVGLIEKTNAQVLINENFNSANGFTPPSGWTNISLNGADPWDFGDDCGYFNDQFTPGSTNMAGKIAMVNTDCSFDYQITELTTPSFNASGAGSTFLDFDNSILNYDAQICNIDVWNGTTWTNVYSIVGANDGAFDANHKSINITEAAGGNTAAQVRFHYEGDYEYWWAIDNVVIKRVSCTQPVATFTVVADCSNYQYSVSTSITSLGDASSVTLSDGTTTYGSPISTTGTFTAGPFSSGIPKAITLVHNNTGCNLTSDLLYSECAPINDSCSKATLLTVQATCTPTPGTIRLTGEDEISDIPSCANDYQGGDVWYSFMATDVDEYISVSSTTSASSSPVMFWDYGFTVYSGGCGNLTELACQNGTYNGPAGIQTAQSIISGLTIGETYQIRVFQDDSYDINSDQVSSPHTMDFNICITPAPVIPNCVSSAAPVNGATDISLFPANPELTWNREPTATSYDVYFGDAAGDESLLASVSDTFVFKTNLSYGSTYYWYVVPANIAGTPTGCESNEFSFTTEAAVPPVNDDAPGAIELIVGAGCSGPVYLSDLATLTTGEPYPSCYTSGSQGEHSMWYKFIAPNSGSVKITTDTDPLGTLTDSRIGLFQVTDVNDYTTFNLIGCDDDNGIIDNGYMSTIFTSDLVGGQTYYVEVDGFLSTTSGSYCIQVEEINPTMLSNSANCADLQEPVGDNSNYTGWVTLVDEAGKLVASVRNPAGGSIEDYGGSYNISGNGVGTPRQDENGVYYLSRNYTINNSGISSPVDVRFYFQPGEIATLAGVTGNATNLSNLNVTKQESTDCNPDFDEANGATSVLTQNANGQVNSVSWIQVTTSSFSNFYLMGGLVPLSGTTVPLAIVIKSIAAKNIGKANQVNWVTAEENKGDRFELERGNDGKTFKLLAKIAANEKPSDYVYYDKSPLENVNYYRLKLISRDGKATYSQTVQATFSPNSVSMDAYPNPTNKSITLQVHGSENGDVTVSDVAGRVVYQTKMTGSELQIDMSKLSNGVYLIHYVDGTLNKVIKINKQ